MLGQTSNTGRRKKSMAYVDDTSKQYRNLNANFKSLGNVIWLSGQNTQHTVTSRKRPYSTMVYTDGAGVVNSHEKTQSVLMTETGCRPC
jgi:hypothetical protein